jgi:hypothetical protein
MRLAPRTTSTTTGARGRAPQAASARRRQDVECLTILMVITLKACRYCTSAAAPRLERLRAGPVPCRYSDTSSVLNTPSITLLLPVQASLMRLAGLSRCK